LFVFIRFRSAAGKGAALTTEQAIFMHARYCFALVGIVLLNTTALAAEKAKQPNVLFIAVDDLNHWVGHLGRNKQTKTPNIDRLAKMGITFTHAYCPAPVCNASRAALMSGMRPGTTGVYDNGQDWRPVIGADKTLTSQFLGAGYEVFGSGKIYHASVHRAKEWTDYFPGKPDQATPHPDSKDDGVGGIKFRPLTNDSRLSDESVVDYGIQQLSAKHDQPFFVAVGIYKPHLPWNVPKKYFDMFPLDQIELPPSQKDDLKDVPASGIRMAQPKGDHAVMLESGRWKEAVQGYLAAIAYSDAQLGRLLDAYDRSPYKENTIIVFWGDHGWHLGEKEHWRKFALWEESTRTPYVWVVPGVTKPNGVCDRTVDLMSVYPTLCALCSIDRPAHVEGEDISPLLRDPQATWDKPALTTFHRNNHAVRTAKWRYIRYADDGEELYDHSKDPYEWTNLANDERFTAVKQMMRKSLPETNQPELPREKAPVRRGQTKAMQD
jgi:arylsulfatase A-like enzyme